MISNFFHLQPNVIFLRHGEQGGTVMFVWTMFHPFKFENIKLICHRCTSSVMYCPKLFLRNLKAVFRSFLDFEYFKVFIFANGFAHSFDH